MYLISRPATISTSGRVGRHINKLYPFYISTSDSELRHSNKLIWAKTHAFIALGMCTSNTIKHHHRYCDLLLIITFGSRIVDCHQEPPAITASTSLISRGHFVRFSHPVAVTTYSLHDHLNEWIRKNGYRFANSQWIEWMENMSLMIRLHTMSSSSLTPPNPRNLSISFWLMKQEVSGLLIASSSSMSMK